MKTVKITKTMLKDPATLLRKVGATHEKQAFPSHVFMNEKDYQVLKTNLKKQFKKEYPFIKKEKIESSVAFELFNLGPVNLKKGIEKGYVLVNEAGINREIEEMKKT